MTHCFPNPSGSMVSTFLVRVCADLKCPLGRLDRIVCNDIILSTAFLLIPCFISLNANSNSSTSENGVYGFQQLGRLRPESISTLLCMGCGPSLCDSILSTRIGVPIGGPSSISVLPSSSLLFSPSFAFSSSSSINQTWLNFNSAPLLLSILVASSGCLVLTCRT